MWYLNGIWCLILKRRGSCLCVPAEMFVWWELADFASYQYIMPPVTWSLEVDFCILSELLSHSLVPVEGSASCKMKAIPHLFLWQASLWPPQEVALLKTSSTMLALICDQLWVSFHRKSCGKWHSLKNNGNSRFGSKFPCEPVCSSASAERDRWVGAKGLGSPSSVSPTVSQSLDSAWGTESCWVPASILCAALLPAECQMLGHKIGPVLVWALHRTGVQLWWIGTELYWCCGQLLLCPGDSTCIRLKFAWGCRVMCQHRFFNSSLGHK